MARFSTRSRYRRKPSSKLPTWVILAICLSASVVLAILLGNLLKLWLNDETYRKLTEPPTDETTAEPKYTASVQKIRAYPFTLGDDPEQAIEYRALSFSMNQPDGTLQYTSPVAQYQNRTCAEEALLSESIASLRTYGIYISGVFYTQAFSAESIDLRYAVAAEEGALMREFLMMGGCEILICGIPFSSVGTETVLNYLSAIRSAIGDTPLGVAIPESLLQNDNTLLAERLLTVCDFCALDMTDAVIENTELNEIGISVEADARLRQIQFYLQQYDMRLLLYDRQTILISAAELRLSSAFQVIRFPVTDTDR